MLSYRSFLRDTGISTGTLVGIFVLMRIVPIGVVNIPRTVLILSFGKVFGTPESYYTLPFSAYLLGLGVLGAVIATLLRVLFREADVAGWRDGIAGALVVAGAMSILYGAAFLRGGPQQAPFPVALVAGLVLLLLASVFAGLGERLARIAGTER